MFKIFLMLLLYIVVSRFLNPLVGYQCGLLREKFPDLNAFCLNIHSLVAIICILPNFHRSPPPTKTVAKLQGGPRFIFRQGLRILPKESQTSGTFQRKACQWGTRPFADRKNYSNKHFIYEKSGQNQKKSGNQLWKTNSLNFASTYSEPFLLFQRKLRCLQALVFKSLVSSARDSTWGQPLPSSPGRRLSQFLDDRNAKKSLLEQ